MVWGGYTFMARILIIDDASFMRVMLKNILESGGHHVVGEASNGLDGFELYTKLNPDLVTMDITMPVLDGIASTSMILRKDSSAKIIICSAMGQQSMVLEAIKAGAKDFVVKPFKPEVVLDSIKKVMK